jgi:hypothetical protein
MDHRKLETPVNNRVPNAQRSNFAGFWGRLLDQAVSSKQEAAWAEFFLFPKCILWSSVRGGKRFAKKANMAELIRLRLARWDAGEKEALWLDAVARSRKPLVAEEPKKDKTDRERLEARVLRCCVWAMRGRLIRCSTRLQSPPKTQATLSV